MMKTSAGARKQGIAGSSTGARLGKKALAKVQDDSPEMAEPTAENGSEHGGTVARGKKAVAGKTKLVRDSFTFPAEDHARLGELKQRALKSGREIKKSELLRAGLTALAAMPDETFLAALDGVERIKTGRPSK